MTYPTPRTSYKPPPLHPGTIYSPTYPHALAANPLAAGVQIGMLGAASGLSYAAVQRAFRMRAGNTVPVSVMRPMLIGTLIGSALGYSGSAWAKSKQSVQPDIKDWKGVSDHIRDNVYGGMSKENMSKYAGLNCLFEKQAIPVFALAALPWLARAATLGFGIAGAKGVHDHGKGAVKSFREGSTRQGWRDAGNAALSGAMTIPWLRPVGKGLQLLRARQATNAGSKLISAGKRLNPLFAPAVTADIVGVPIMEGLNIRAGRRALAEIKPKNALEWITGSKIPNTRRYDAERAAREHWRGMKIPEWLPPSDRARIEQWQRQQRQEAMRPKSASVKQAYGTLAYDPQLAGKTLTDLYLAIRSDFNLPAAEKSQLIQQIKGVTGFAPDSTPISALTFRGLGGALGFLISKYFGMGAGGKLVSTVVGFGLGNALHKQLNRPKNPTPGYRLL